MQDKTISFDEAQELVDSGILNIALHMVCYKLAAKQNVGKTEEELELIAEKYAFTHIKEAAALFKQMSRHLQ